MRIRHLARITAAAAVGRRDLLADWYAAARADGVPVADLQEATLQVFLFAGYPRTIDAFLALAAESPPPLEPPRDDLDERGRELFGRVYGPYAADLTERLEALHADFARFLLRDAYGQVLARPFLPLGEREFMAVAMLAALRTRAQLKAHVHGALRVGVAPDEIRTALAAAEEAVGELPEAREIVDAVLV